VVLEAAAAPKPRVSRRGELAQYITGITGKKHTKLEKFGFGSAGVECTQACITAPMHIYVLGCLKQPVENPY